MLNFSAETIINILLSIAALLLVFTVHECAHGYAAYLLGDTTAKDAGRLSLNPIKHLDPFGALCLLIFRFGWAKPVPINPYRFKSFRLGTALCSLAGPLSNVIFAFLVNLIWDILFYMNVSVNPYVVSFLQILYVYNLSIAVFNLIPIPPLDGSKILLSVLPQKAHTFVLNYERYGFILLIVLLWTKLLNGILNTGVNNLMMLLGNMSGGILSLFWR